MIRIGLIGLGYWGPNLARNIVANPDMTLVGICDLDPARLEKQLTLYPAVRGTTHADEIIAAGDIDAVVIATPLVTHFDLAMKTLRAGKHALVEKPLAGTAGQCALLAEEAERRNLVLLVDHIFVYTSAVQKMRSLMSDKRFGAIRYFDSTRINLGMFREDNNVLWDLAIHDLSILTYLVDSQPTALSATGHSHVPGQLENIAYLTLFYAENLVAHIGVNWLSPVKVRRTIIAGTGQMIVYDDLKASEKLKLYNHAIEIADTPDEIYKQLISYRTGDLWSPHLDNTEALQRLLEHFVVCINSSTVSLSGPAEALAIIHILEAADASLQRQGAPVTL
jgi:predicted dehydrogenase